MFFMESYGTHSAKYLKNLTHSEAPWIDAPADVIQESRSEQVITKQG